MNSRDYNLRLHVANASAHAAGDFSSKQVDLAEETVLLLGSINHKCDLGVKPQLVSDRCLDVTSQMRFPQFLLPR
jgi:hypothetical protein